MKKILLCCVLFFIGFNSYGQYPGYYLTFDTGSLIFYGLGPGYTPSGYFPDSNWISIDTIDYHNNQWQIGRPQKTVFNSAYSYPNAIVTDTLHPCLPNDTSVFIITTPTMILGGVVSFEYELNIDSGDLAMVEFSPDSGASWINPLTDTTEDTFEFNFGYMQPKPNLSVSTTGWEKFTSYVLSPPYYYYYSPGVYYSYPDLFRFTLITDSNTAPRDGWMIDNFFIVVYAEGVPIVSKTNLISLYPNPATTSLTVTASNTINQISITNLLGQIVYSHVYNSQQVAINVGDWPVGMYFVKINDGEVRKFLKE